MPPPEPAFIEIEDLLSKYDSWATSIAYSLTEVQDTDIGLVECRWLDSDMDTAVLDEVAVICKEEKK
jgi:hypothetical protein